MIEISDEDFDRLVDQALERIPRALLDQLNNVALVVESRHPNGPGILGLYEGLALTERTSEYSFELPDKITIYKDSLCEYCTTHEELVEQVTITVVHEIAHHFGIDDDRLHELGWG